MFLNTKYMQDITFYKMSGSGNDFIIIDNRTEILSAKDLQLFASKVCKRRMSAGADGLILIENSDKADFKWQFFNSDGTIGDMCGNGARCAAVFAYRNKIADKDMSFETLAGSIYASVSIRGFETFASINLTQPIDFKADFSVVSDTASFRGIFVNTGVPHFVIHTDNIERTDVFAVGRKIRNLPEFSKKGVNVNFVKLIDSKTIRVRTYERGVEGETLACGTGAAASAIAGFTWWGLRPPTSVITQSGEILEIQFKAENGNFSDVYLKGAVRTIYKGVLCNHSWEY